MLYVETIHDLLPDGWKIDKNGEIYKIVDREDNIVYITASSNSFGDLKQIANIINKTYMEGRMDVECSLGVTI